MFPFNSKTLRFKFAVFAAVASKLKTLISLKESLLQIKCVIIPLFGKSICGLIQ